MQDLNLHHLELFHQVAKAGGITAATRAMSYGIQQPAVSAQISLLEAGMGVRLFHRRPFKLTPPGQELYDFIAPFFGKLPQVAERIAGKSSSHLRMAAPGIAMKNYLPEVIFRIRKKHPAMELTLLDVGSEGVFRLLEREEIDLGIVDLDAKVPQGISKETLGSLPLLLLLPAGLPMPRGGLAKLAGEQALIRTSSRSSMARMFEKGLAKKGIRWPARMEVSSIELVEAYVSRGMGVGVTVKVPGVGFSKAVKTIELKDFGKLTIAGVWRGTIHPLAAEVLAELRRVASSI
ncbi:LysR family transcriptional regulator [Akkermansiaceae bacterium]|nr:LysR family transcriptional regulator [Akkermansiaceae bacterium]